MPPITALHGREDRLEAGRTARSTRRAGCGTRGGCPPRAAMRRRDREGVELGAEHADPERRGGSLVGRAPRSGAGPIGRRRRFDDHQRRRARSTRGTRTRVALGVAQRRRQSMPNSVELADQRAARAPPVLSALPKIRRSERERQTEGDDREVDAAGAQRGKTHEHADGDRPSTPTRNGELERQVVVRDRDVPRCRRPSRPSCTARATAGP